MRYRVEGIYAKKRWKLCRGEKYCVNEEINGVKRMGCYIYRWGSVMDV